MRQKYEKESEEKNGSTPLSSVIAQLKGYVKNPKMATEETLTDIVTQLESIQSDIEGDDTDDGEKKDKGIMIAIGFGKHMKNKEKE